MTGFSRRGLAFGVASATTALAMGEAVAQAPAGRGAWLDMVKAQHAMILATFDRILATNNSQAAERATLQGRLTYLLIAHFVAEENVIYPALAKFGMTPASTHLYAEQDQAKVINAELGWSPKNDAGWLRQVGDMRKAVYQHAVVEEERDLFPKLQQAAGPFNARLTSEYTRQYARVGKT